MLDNPSISGDSPSPLGSGHLLANLLLFGRLLHGLGLDVNPGRMLDLLQALDYISIGVRTDFYNTARALLVHSREDLAKFDEAFALWWRPPVAAISPLDVGTVRRVSNRRKPQVTAFSLKEDSQASEAPGNHLPPDQIQVQATYSTREVLRHKDFADFNAEEIRQSRRMLDTLIWRLGVRRTRRLQPGRGPKFDLKRTLRSNLGYGSEILSLSQRQPRTRPRPLVLLCDISGSMERYTRLLLYFVYALSNGLQDVETFVFGTRLTRITRQLQMRDVDQAMHDVGRTVSDWAGGTRTGECLKTFNFVWARRVLGRGAGVIIISDGWDRGDPSLLSTEMARLHRSCFRLIWLNPLLGNPDYEPLTRGIQAALPYVDDFLPVHNLSSLEQLAQHLLSLDRATARRKALPARR